MAKKKRVFLIILIMIFLTAGAAVFVVWRSDVGPVIEAPAVVKEIFNFGDSAMQKIKPESLPVKDSIAGNNEKEIAFDSVLLDIPFVSQAPSGNWDDERQQDGCEEASVLMTMHWISGQILTRENAEIEITAIADWEERKFGSYHDTSAKDTIKIIVEEYFDYRNAELKENVSLEDIKTELSKGNALIVPVDGQIIGNPYYTAPGPERHMLVVRGYDAKRGEIITNDPGTRRGEKYRYDENVFFASIRDYPSGDHIPITKIEKNMIVIKP